MVARGADKKATTPRPKSVQGKTPTATPNGSLNRGEGKKSSVSELYSLNNHAAEYDPENENDFGDAINIPVYDIDYEHLEASKKGEEKGALLRQANVGELISSSSGKYAGKRASRGDFDDQVDQDGVDVADESGDDEYSDKDEGGIWDSNTSDAFGASKIEDRFSDGEDEVSSDASNGDEPHQEAEDDTKGIDDTAVPSQESDMKKAQHTKNQLLVWDDIMAIRMLLQPVLTQAIRFPQRNDHEHFSKNDPNLSAAFKEVTEELAKLINELLNTQEQYLNHNPQAPHDISKKRPRAEGGCEEWWDSIQTANESLMAYCGTVLDKWSGRIQVSSGKIFSKKFQSINQGFMAQIESLFSDRDRLFKRTTRIRKDQTIYGKQNQQEFDDEIFDDTDFYQTLLKELIANGVAGYGTSEGSDAKRPKTKLRKDYLRNASKGRMINYDVQDKLVHFMAPDDRPIACDWNLDDLFVNLFSQSKSTPRSGS